MNYLFLGIFAFLFLKKNNAEPSSKENNEVLPEPENEVKMTKLEEITFIPSPNFTIKENRSVDKIIIHITQGSFASAIGWFKMRSSKVSAHFLVSKAGEIIQMVKTKDVAWHAKPWNTRSIGIEHEGFYDYKAQTTSFTQEQYQASAQIVRELAIKYNIPLDREHIIGHREVPNVTKTCPGYMWNWDYYMNLLNERNNI